jgi:hypothetical protein
MNLKENLKGKENGESKKGYQFIIWRTDILKILLKFFLKIKHYSTLELGISE